MKSTILTIVLMMFTSLTFAQINPIDFEPEGNGADWTWEVFENADNPPVEFIANPDPTGANTSATVAQFTAKANGASFAGTISDGTGPYLLDQTNRTITIAVWKSVISDVGIKLETESGFSPGEIKVANTVTGEWEEITFDFSSYANPPEGEQYTGITVFPDFQERDQDNVVYFDNITFSGESDGGDNGDGDLAGPRNPIDFETDGYGADWTWTVFENEDNPAVEIIDNPDQMGANTSDRVAQFTARANGASFAGTISNDIGDFVLDQDNRTITIMVWKSVISNVGIKLETDSGFSPGEILIANTVTDEWEELTFDFSDYANPPDEPYTGITIFPDFQERDQDNVVYFDNITFSGESDGGDNGGTPEGNLLTNGDFESGDDGSWYGNALDIRTEGDNSYNFADVATAGNPWDVNLSQLVELTPGESYVLTFDASTSEGNTRDMIVGIGQSQDPFYADVETVTLTETTQTFSLNLAATDDGTGTDFGSPDSRVIFDMGADAGIVVLDNVSLEVAGSDPITDGEAPRNPIDFEDDGFGADWTWTVFENASNPALEIISNPDPTGANTSATVAQFTALADGQPFAGVESSHGNSDLGSFVLDETNSTITIMVWKSTISDVGVKLVAESGWAQPEIKVSNTVVNEWEELTFDFSEIPNPPAEEGLYDQIVVFPDFVDGDRTQDNVVYFDNITFSDGEVGVSVDEADDLARTFELNQNYPNPFNPTTNISYTLPESADVKLEVFNAVGQKVATLVNSTQNAGTHTVSFDASNLASGVYLYRLTSGSQVQINKMLLLK